MSSAQSTTQHDESNGRHEVLTLLRLMSEWLECNWQAIADAPPSWNNRQSISFEPSRTANIRTGWRLLVFFQTKPGDMEGASVWDNTSIALSRRDTSLSGKLTPSGFTCDDRGAFLEALSGFTSADFNDCIFVLKRKWGIPDFRG